MTERDDQEICNASQDAPYTPIGMVTNTGGDLNEGLDLSNPNLIDKVTIAHNRYNRAMEALNRDLPPAMLLENLSSAIDSISEATPGFSETPLGRLVEEMKGYFNTGGIEFSSMRSAVQGYDQLTGAANAVTVAEPISAAIENIRNYLTAFANISLGSAEEAKGNMVAANQYYTDSGYHGQIYLSEPAQQRLGIVGPFSKKLLTSNQAPASSGVGDVG
jgi:hypothetical protein